MTTRLLVLGTALVMVTACVARPAEPSVTSAPTAVAVATDAPTPTPASDPSPTASAPTPEPAPRVTREIAGIPFALVHGAADLRIETAISRESETVVVSTVAADVPAVEREFDRSFRAPPVIYVFATTASYADGFVRIFGYPRATAAFVAENSISFFEPSVRLIAVNWEAVADRRPIAAIRHELTHLLTLDACAPRCDLVPAWLNEGQGRLAEALVPGGDWRLVRVRYEAASMAATETLIPLNTLVSQFAWNSLVDWAGYYKYQQAARAVELLRDDVGGAAPIARVYDQLRRGRNLAQAYAVLTGRSFDEFLAGLPARMRSVLPQSRGIIPVGAEGAATSYLLYGFAPSAPVSVTISGPRGSESWPVLISPYGAGFDTIPATRLKGGYTVSVQDAGDVFTLRLRKTDAGSPRDSR